MRSLKINRLLPIYISTLPLKFGVDIQSQSKVSPETKKSKMAARRPFWKWRRWKSTGSYPYIEVLCHLSLQLIFKAKLKRKSKDYVYGIWVYKALDIWKGYYRVKKSLVSYVKPWTEARNNKYMKYHSKLTYQLSFWNVSRKVDYHAGGKWFIHGPKRRKENQLLKLESGNQNFQYGCLAAILKLTLLKINRLLHIYISIVPLKFGVDIQSQTKVRVRKPKNPIWPPGGHFERDIAENQ